jgi:VanZ family protein
MNSAFAFNLDRLVQLVSYLAVAVIIVLSLLPGSSRPHTGAPGQGEHVVAYFLTAFLFGLRSQSLSQITRIAIIAIAGAAALEAAQLLVPARNAQVMDFVASSVGILAGLCAGRLFNPLYRRVLA